MLNDKLQIILITYNRKEYLKRTFDYILAESSPIKDFDITVLDNASTDGSSELIDEYCAKFPNLKHIRHKINIGGNANICRAFEYGKSSGKEYIWVLCDDDKYDFSHLDEVEKEIENKTDIICVSNYAFKDKKDYTLAENQIFQLTFVPAGIYRADLIDNTVMMNMYDAVYTMFQQACLSISAINNGKKIKVLDNAVVFNGLHFEDKCESIQLTRGVDDENSILKRKKDTKWILGYSNILSLLKDKKLIGRCMDRAINYKDIYETKFMFFYDVCYYFIRFDKYGENYYTEIWKTLNLKLKLQLLFYTIFLSIPLFILYFYPSGDYFNIRLLGKTIKRVKK